MSAVMDAPMCASADRSSGSLARSRRRGPGFVRARVFVTVFLALFATVFLAVCVTVFVAVFAAWKAALPSRGGAEQQSGERLSA